MSYTPKYIVSAGSLVIEHCDEDGSCVSRTNYTPERFAQERAELPSSVVAAYESGKPKKAAAPAPNDELIASNDHVPPVKGWSAYAEKNKTAAKKATKATKATKNANKRATNR